MIKALRKVSKRMHYPLKVMFTCVRWYAACPLSLRHIQEMMAERGVVADHATVHRWAIKILPFWRRCSVGANAPLARSGEWMSPTSRVAGQWKYLYRVIDRDGKIIDFLLRTKRDHAVARSFFEQAIGLPEKLTIDQSGANTAAIHSIRVDSGADIEMRQSKYLNTSSNRTIEPSNAPYGQCSD